VVIVPDLSLGWDEFVRMCIEYHHWPCIRKSPTDPDHAGLLYKIAAREDGSWEILTVYGFGIGLIFKKEGTDPPQVTFVRDMDG
jgi:hypothetical protein